MKIYESQSFENINVDGFTLILNVDFDSTYEKKNLVSWKLKNDFDSNAGFFISLNENNSIEFGIGSLNNLKNENVIRTKYVPTQFSNINLTLVHNKESSKFYVNNVKIADSYLPSIEVKGDFILFGNNVEFDYYNYVGKINSVEIIDRVILEEELFKHI